MHCVLVECCTFWQIYKVCIAYRKLTYCAQYSYSLWRVVWFQKHPPSSTCNLISWEVTYEVTILCECMIIQKKSKHAHPLTYPSLGRTHHKNEQIHLY